MSRNSSININDNLYDKMYDTDKRKISHNHGNHIKFIKKCIIGKYDIPPERSYKNDIVKK